MTSRRTKFVKGQLAWDIRTDSKIPTRAIRLDAKSISPFFKTYITVKEMVHKRHIYGTENPLWFKTHKKVTHSFSCLRNKMHCYIQSECLMACPLEASCRFAKKVVSWAFTLNAEWECKLANKSTVCRVVAHFILSNEMCKNQKTFWIPPAL